MPEIVKFPSSFTRIVFAMLALVTLTSCQRSTMDEKIPARSGLGFNLWLSRMGSRLTPTEIRDLQDAVQQVKFSVMTKYPGLSSKEFEQAVFSEIYERSVRDLLVRAVEIRIERTRSELRSFEGMQQRLQQVAKNSDPERREAIATNLTSIDQRIAERESTIAQLEERKLQLVGR